MYGPLCKDVDGPPHRLTLEEDTPDIFEWILRYLYRDDTRFQGTGQALGVYEAAHKYQIDSLVKICSQVSIGKVNVCLDGWEDELPGWLRNGRRVKGRDGCWR